MIKGSSHPASAINHPSLYCVCSLILLVTANMIQTVHKYLIRYIHSPFASIPLLLYMILIFHVSHHELPPTAKDFPDWLMHGICYFVFFFLAWHASYGLAPDRPQTNNILIALAISVIYGLFDEWHQSFIPSRQASGYDILADGFGASAGAIAAVCIHRYFLKNRRRKL